MARHLAWLRDAGVREVPQPRGRAAAAPAAAARPAVPEPAQRQGAPSRWSARSVRWGVRWPWRGASGGGGGRSWSPRRPGRRRRREGLRLARAPGRPHRPRRLPPLQAAPAAAPHLVFGVGDPNAELVFVGEGPGADEDLQGEPFVGKAGQLLTRMIEAMGYRREQVYIANVVKCRPPGNRNPEPDEIEACEPFLQRAARRDAARR